ncbi:MAG: MarR family transcriptional regulator [Gallionellaceae bacterium]|jgi:MarR family transcriptional repressor of emrRAB|nr:MarR family transcriptional regulator [Gallionellaceae bacterium]
MNKFSATDGRIARIHERMPNHSKQHMTLHRLAYHVHKLTQDNLNLLLKNYDLTTVSYTALMVLYGSDNETQRASELCVACTEKPANMTRVCDDLTERGLISRQKSDTDRRGVVITLTAAGRELAESVSPLYWKIVNRIYAGIDDASMKKLETMLRHQLNNLAV